MNNMIIKYENNNELSFQYHTPFIFSEFDSWVRSRYGIPNNVGLIIQDENEIEIIPSIKNSKKKETIYLKRNIKNSNKESLKSPHIINKLLVLFYPSLLVLILSYCILPHYMSLKSIQNFNAVNNKFINILIYFNVLSWKNTIIDSFIAFLCWSFTYLFIRRLFNPETTDSTFEKYSSDAFFGGLAAAASSMLKIILKNSMNN